MRGLQNKKSSSSKKPPPRRPGRQGEVRTVEDIEHTLQSVEKTLASIEMLLRQMPEVLAATYIKMNEEYQQARLQGKRFDDLWSIEQIPMR